MQLANLQVKSLKMQSGLLRASNPALFSSSWEDPMPEGLQVMDSFTASPRILSMYTSCLHTYPLSEDSHTEFVQTHLSSGESTWKVLSMTVVHCRQRMTKVLGRGLSVFISWHSVGTGRKE